MQITLYYNLNDNKGKLLKVLEANNESIKKWVAWIG